MFNKLLAWALLAFVAYATISPILYRPTLAASSSLEHLFAFAILGVLFYLAYPRQVLFSCLIVLGSAIILECVQVLAPDRHGRIQDAIEKLVGGAAGIAAVHVAILASNMLHRRSQK